MPTPVLAAWRTVITTLVVCLMLHLGFAFLVWHGAVTEFAAVAYGSLCMWASVTATGQALNSLGQHLGNGSGLKGALAALTSDTKPGEPAP